MVNRFTTCGECVEERPSLTPSIQSRRPATSNQQPATSNANFST
jgi:hypothetical protein